MTASELSLPTKRDALFIGGRWVEASSARRLEVENPATETVFGWVPDGDERDVDRAVVAAHAAFPSWSMSSIDDRRRILRGFADALASRREILAQLVTREMGAPIALSRIVQADLPVDVLNGFIAAIDSLDEFETIGNSRIVREPVGVVAAIAPWNYPIHQAVSKIGAAIAAGCTVVLKPSKVTPISAFLLAEAAQEAGLPDGVLNIVTGSGRNVGEALVAHPLVDMVSFTGSTSAGRHVMASAANFIKRVSLELGGKSANVILADADFEVAVRRGAEHLLENGGQTCTAWSRMLVPREAQGDVEEILKKVFREVVVGDPLLEETTMGPVATADQRRVVDSYIRAGVTEGARTMAGQSREHEGRGHYVDPVAFGGVTSGMSIAREEVFGPLLAVMPYDDEEHALALANDSIYGLSGGVWSTDQERALGFARRMRTGQVSVNGGSFNPAAPFGGYKQSGVGRELGRHGLDDFLELKAIQL